MFTTYNIPNDYNYDDYGLNVTYIPHSKVPYILQETTELRTQNYNLLLNRTNPALHVDLQRDIGYNVCSFTHLSHPNEYICTHFKSLPSEIHFLPIKVHVLLSITMTCDLKF